jgi:hypothetical protein
MAGWKEIKKMKSILERIEGGYVNETDMSVANEILRQLGGNKFVVMTGAKNLLGDRNYLAFSIGGGAKDKINFVKITLNGKDYYDIEFGKKSKNAEIGYKKIKEVEDIDVENLRRVFTQYTGFEISL